MSLLGWGVTIERERQPYISGSPDERNAPPSNQLGVRYQLQAIQFHYIAPAGG